ncbi:helix-turn-helix domain-containing protein, partial [Nonomuraea sp. NPDC049784]|uniref:helix-turn-helix domain-containing protein n=1 Tax=Nonomuraea sp. NPDC049784 TaxID=3154361 RepID=UPI0033E93384
MAAHVVTLHACRVTARCAVLRFINIRIGPQRSQWMQNVLNALRVLEEVAIRQPAGVGELARVLGLPKSTVQRSLRTLHDAG